MLINLNHIAHVTYVINELTMTESLTHHTTVYSSTPTAETRSRSNTKVFLGDTTRDIQDYDRNSRQLMRFCP